jgi:hypothetical protein
MLWCFLSINLTAERQASWKKMVNFFYLPDATHWRFKEKISTKIFVHFAENFCAMCTKMKIRAVWLGNGPASHYEMLGGIILVV